MDEIGEGCAGCGFAVIPPGLIAVLLVLYVIITYPLILLGLALTVVAIIIIVHVIRNRKKQEK